MLAEIFAVDARPSTSAARCCQAVSEAVSGGGSIIDRFRAENSFSIILPRSATNPARNYSHTTAQVDDCLEDNASLARPEAEMVMYGAAQKSISEAKRRITAKKGKFRECRPARCGHSSLTAAIVALSALVALSAASSSSLSSLALSSAAVVGDDDVTRQGAARHDRHPYVHHHKKRQQDGGGGGASGAGHHHQQCAENEICSTNNAHVCKNNTCVSACSLKGMRECVCDSEEENYCYLCCGNADNKCLPAHEHDILRNNGERWERESCARCRMNGAEMEGSACDDRDPQRLCLQGKCSKSVCHAKHEGAYCDRKSEKVCVDDVCDNPCSKIASHLMVCDCPAIDPDTGFASEDRCQLCCYDFTVKPASRRCQSAFRKYRIANAQNRPIWRVGLDCAGGKRCNRYGICTNNATPRASFTSSPMVPLALFLLFLVVVAVLAAVFTTSESF